MTKPLISDTQALLAETRALRTLARSLVGDPDSADDLVQGTWLAALRSRPPVEGVGRWLRGILRNLLRQERRSTERRMRRERDVARAGVQPDGSRNLEQLEVLQAVVEAVRGLAEPYRDTVMARFFRDEKPAEIAKRQGVPHTTVHTRLHRALVMLRQSLDRRFAEDRHAWRTSLAFLLNTKTLIPSIVMSSKLKVAVLVVAVLGLFWSLSTLWVTQPNLPGGTTLDENRQLLAVREAGAVPENVEEASLAERQILTPGPIVPEDRSASGTLSVTGIVRDDARRPLSGARVWAGRREATTGEDGQYLLELSPRGSLGFLYAEAAGHAATRLLFSNEGGASQVRLDFDLRKEFRIRGRVTDVDGQPIEGAKVDTFFNRSDPVATDAEGKFVLAGLDPGRVEHMLDARKDGYVRAGVTVRTDGEQAEQDLVLDLGNEVWGVVSGPSGVP